MGAAKQKLLYRPTPPYMRIVTLRRICLCRPKPQAVLPRRRRFGNIQTDTQGRVGARIAITRKKYLREINERYDGDTVSVIGAAPNKNGVFEFIFSQESSTPSDMQQQRFIDAALLAASFVLLIVAIDVHQERRMQALVDRETEALTMLRAMRPATSLFNDVDASMVNISSGRTIKETLGVIGETLVSLPNGSVVSRFEVTNQTVTASGFFPAPPDGSQSSTAILSTGPSDYPGFNRFELAKPPDAAP